MCWRALNKQVGSPKSWNCLILNPPLAFPEPRKLEMAKLVGSVENQGIHCLERLGRISLGIVSPFAEVAFDTTATGLRAEGTRMLRHSPALDGCNKC